jgi:hypothetical protein
MSMRVYVAGLYVFNTVRTFCNPLNPSNIRSVIPKPIFSYLYWCTGVLVYGCMGVWVYGCMDVWVYGCIEYPILDYSII